MGAGSLMEEAEERFGDSPWRTPRAPQSDFAAPRPAQCRPPRPRPRARPPAPAPASITAPRLPATALEIEQAHRELLLDAFDRADGQGCLPYELDCVRDWLLEGRSLAPRET